MYLASWPSRYPNCSPWPGSLVDVIRAPLARDIVRHVSDDGLRDLLLQLSPSAGDKLRAVLIRDQLDRDAIAAELLRFGDANGDGWADVIDTLSMYPDVRRQAVQLLAEIDSG